MLIALYWANLNMWINDIELGDGTSLSAEGHALRLLIQIALILVIAWIGEITPFKNEKKGISKMDVFQGRISSATFNTGDRIIIGNWHESPLGKFSDVMWANPEGKRTLIAPSEKVAEYLNSIYSFDETIIQEIEGKKQRLGPLARHLFSVVLGVLVRFGRHHRDRRGKYK